MSFYTAEPCFKIDLRHATVQYIFSSFNPLDYRLGQARQVPVIYGKMQNHRFEGYEMMTSKDMTKS